MSPSHVKDCEILEGQELKSDARDTELAPTLLPSSDIRGLTLISFIGENQFGMKDEKARSPFLLLAGSGPEVEEVHFRICGCLQTPALETLRHLTMSQHFPMMLFLSMISTGALYSRQVCHGDPLLLSFLTSKS